MAKAWASKLRSKAVPRPYELPNAAHPFPWALLMVGEAATLPGAMNESDNPVAAEHSVSVRGLGWV